MRLLALLVALALGSTVMLAAPKADASYALTADEAVSIICFDGSAWDCETALAVAWRESRWTPDAYNPGCRCVGVFQIAGIHGYTADVLVVPTENVRIAHDLYLKAGWKPWRTQ